MSLVHLHLVLNHFPIIGSFFALAFVAYGVLRKNETLTNAARVILIFVACVTVPVYFTGEPAEESVEQLQIDGEQFIEQHESAAQIAFAASLLVGIVAGVSLLPWWRTSKSITTVLVIGTLALTLLMVRVGNLGGQIRHSEIRAGASPANVESHSRDRGDE